MYVRVWNNLMDWGRGREGKEKEYNKEQEKTDYVNSTQNHISM